MNQPQSKVIELNNQAVSLIEDGHYQAASETLATALQCAQKVLTESTCLQQQEQTQPSVDDWMTSTSEDNDDILCDEQQKVSVYRKPILIPNSLENCDGMGALTSVICIFNLALSLQLLASTLESDKKTTPLKKSKSLYELTFNLQLRECPNIIFSLAVVNNLGAIHKELDDCEKAEKCFERVLSTLMFAIDCGDKHVSAICGCFIKNTAHLYSQKCAAAAA